MTAVNIKGSPDRGDTAKNVLSPIAELASSAIGFSAPDEVLCNANPALKEIVPPVLNNEALHHGTSDSRGGSRKTLGERR